MCFLELPCDTRRNGKLIKKKRPSGTKPKGLKCDLMENGIICGVERNVPMNALTVTEPANVDAIRS